MSTTVKTPEEIEIRKLRKKLRQIENLERHDRDLFEEEVIKVLKKDAIRERLRKLLIDEAEKQAHIEVEQAQEAKAKSAKEEKRQRVPSKSTIACQPKDDVSPTIESTEDDLPPSYNEIVCEQNSGQKQKTGKDASQKIKEEKSSVKEQELSEDKKDFSKKDQVKNELSQRKQIKKSWNRSQFIVYDLEGHNDVVTDIDSNGDILVTASFLLIDIISTASNPQLIQYYTDMKQMGKSKRQGYEISIILKVFIDETFENRDTTIRSWNLKNFEEIHIFGGHSGSVSCVKLLTPTQSKKIGESMFSDDSKCLYMLSGSFDCTFKIWQIQSGKMMKSVYTYNPVTQLSYFDKEEMFLTVSDGGKLDMWNIKSAENIYSGRIHDGEAITGLKVEDDHIYTSSSEGVLKVHQWRKKKLVCLYKSEELRMADMRLINQRNIRNIGVFNQIIYYGDDGINIKAVNWKKGIVQKLLNHTEDFGVTDAIFCNQDSLFTSAYDMDNGLAYINVRTLPDTEYIGTLNDEATGQIKCIHCCRGSIPNGDLLLAVGGLELKIWKLIASSRIPNDLSVIPTRFLPKLSTTGADSGTESEYTDDDDEEEEEESDSECEDKSDSTANSGLFASCTLL